MLTCKRSSRLGRLAAYGMDKGKHEKIQIQGEPKEKTKTSKIHPGRTFPEPGGRCTTQSRSGALLDMSTRTMHRLGALF